MNLNTIALLAAALFSLLIGFVLVWLSMRGDGKKFAMLNPFSWLLIALFPVFLLYAFFPNESKAEGTVLTFKLGGVLAAFVLIWMVGMAKSKKAFESKLLTECQNQVTSLHAQLKAGNRVPDPIVLTKHIVHS